MAEKTVAQLFELAIAVEHYMEALYTALAEKFIATPTVADFWRRLAEQEQMHALQLEVIREDLSATDLQATSNFLSAKFEALLATPIDQKLAAIQNLDDAFALAVEVETPETNALFSFLIKHFSRNPQAESLLLESLQQHIEQLADFSRFFGLGDNRRRIKSR